MEVSAAPLILLVDGCRDARYLNRTILEHVGYRVLETETGEDGLRLARELRPALIITEFPVPVPGYRSLTEAIRADPALAGTRILSATTQVLPSAWEHALRAGVDGFLPKPLSLPDLVRAVGRIISPAAAARVSHDAAEAGFSPFPSS